jgi:hypothetical protein
MFNQEDAEKLRQQKKQRKFDILADYKDQDFIDKNSYSLYKFSSELGTVNFAHSLSAT